MFAKSAEVPAMGRASRALAFLVLCASQAMATTWVVDAANGPGANFTTINAALSASAIGDRILVRAGVYNESLTITHGITIVGWLATTYPVTVPADLSANALFGTILVTGIPLGQQVVVSGFSIVRPTTLGGYSFGAQDCPGSVVFDRILTANGGCAAINCHSVILQDVRIRQQSGALPPTPGVLVYASRMHASDLDATATDLGTEPNYSPSAPAALEVTEGSTISIARVKLIGATGGGPWLSSNTTPSGGPAIMCTQASIVAIVDDGSGLNYIVGGHGGFRAAGGAAIPSGAGASAVVSTTQSLVFNKGPLVPVAGPSGSNFGAGGVPAPTPTITMNNNGVYYALNTENPAMLRLFANTGPGGNVLVNHYSAAPYYPVIMGWATGIELFLSLPSVQFLGGLPETAFFQFAGNADANRILNVSFNLPAQLGNLAGLPVVMQAGDDVQAGFFLTNPCIFVIGF